MKKLLMIVLGLGLTALPVLAQAPAPAPADTSAVSSGHLPDRFQIDAGFFRVNSKTVLWRNTGSGVQNEVDFENDLGLKPIPRASPAEARLHVVFPREFQDVGQDVHVERQVLLSRTVRDGESQVQNDVWILSLRPGQEGSV
jgi:hypothetical protein